MTDLEIVQEAQKVIEDEIIRADRFLARADEIWTAQPEMDDAHRYKRILLAHKAFFDRHKRLETYAGDLCEVCEYSEYRASYPCPESVAQAKAILGVE